MELSNAELANILKNMADSLEEQEENIYRIRAYKRAANVIKRLRKIICRK